MSSEVVRTFEMFGSRFEVTAELDAFNQIRSGQNREADAIVDRYSSLLRLMQEDLKRLTQEALDRFISVTAKIHTELEVASIGFAELQHYQSEVLPRIGKRLIFKHTENELITVEEVAEHIQLDAEAHFTGFLNEVQRVEDKQKNDWIQREYIRMTRNTPAAAGSFGSGMSPVAGVLAVNAGASLIQGISGRILKAIDDSEAANAHKKALGNGIKALMAAFSDMAGQLESYCVGCLQAEAGEELEKTGRKSFQEVSQKRREELGAKLGNYRKAYQDGDVAPERYAECLLTVASEIPYNDTLYQRMYQLALDTSDAGARAAVWELVQYLGIDGSLRRWMDKEGIPAPRSGNESAPGAQAESDSPAQTAEKPEKKTARKEKTAAGKTDQPCGVILHCMWKRGNPSEGGLPLRTMGLRPDGTVLMTGDPDMNYCEEVAGWRNIVALCSCMNIPIGLRANGTLVLAGMKKDHPLYRTLAGWRDITAVSAGIQHVLGLKKDGTVAAACIGEFDDGRCDVESWRDITAIAAGRRHSVGLRADGTVVAVGQNNNGQCSVAGWRNIAAISASFFTMGLTKDGRMIVANAAAPNGAPSENPGNNVVAISAGSNHGLELRADGTVTALGANDAGQLNVSGWKDIVAISAGDGYSAGVQADGTVVATGGNTFGECGVKGWKLGPYSPRQAKERDSLDQQSAAWKAAGLCPFCGGKVGFLKKCKSCGRQL